MPLTRPIAIVVLLLALAWLTFQGFGKNEEITLRRTRLMMGTVVEIVARGKERAVLDEAMTAAFAEMGRIETLMTPEGDQSDVARLSGPINEAAISEETAEVIALGLQVAERSEGRFDLTLGRIKRLWGIESDTPRLPSPEEIAAALSATGLRALRLEGRRVVKADPALMIDLGGIAKGYAIDRAIDILRTAGIASASVNAGGDLRLLGRREGTRPWRIGIQHPRESGSLLATLELRDVAVVTSGDYERFFEQDGRRYHHLFDPRTGYPASACQSVTVVAPSAALADALATAAFVLGPEKGLELLQEYPGTEGLLVDAKGRKFVSAGLRERLKWP